MQNFAMKFLGFTFALLFFLAPLTYAQTSEIDQAKAFCVEQGGVVDSVTSDALRFEVCRIGEKSAIEVLTLAREVKTHDTLAVKNLIMGASRSRLFPGNPASIYCARVSGKTIIVDAADGQYNLCQFKDGSLIEEWTLFRGPKDEANQALLKILAI